MTNYQRDGSESNSDAGRQFERAVYCLLGDKLPDLQPSFAVEIGHLIKKRHRFDFGSSQHKAIIECKSHTWTRSGKVPSAKMTTWDQAMLYFYLAPRGWRKLFVVKKDLRHCNPESLCEYYLRTHSHLIPDEVEFWQVDENQGTIEQVAFDPTG